MHKLYIKTSLHSLCVIVGWSRLINLNVNKCIITTPTHAAVLTDRTTLQDSVGDFHQKNI